MWKSVIELTDEVRTTHNWITSLVDELHAETGISTRLRAVLEYLHRNGPNTVPDIARARRVSRQHIQTAFNELHALDLVVYQPNPSHQRSHLVSLTKHGEETIVEMQVIEQAELGILVKKLDPERLVDAAETLRQLRKALPARKNII